MMITIKQKFIPIGSPNRPGRRRKAQGVLFHTTNNWKDGAGDELHGEYMATVKDRVVSWHVTVDKDSATQHIPFDENAFHAGDGNGMYNTYWIGVEIACEAVEPGEPLDLATYRNAVDVVAQIMLQEGFTSWEQLQPHKVVYGKDCPHHTLFVHDRFKRDVFERMGIKLLPAVLKERVYAQGGVLKRCDGDYKIKATDVRYLKLDGKKLKFQFVARTGAKVSDLLAEYGADFATNAPYFWDGKVLGDAVADGQVIAQAYGKMLSWHEFGVKGGRPQIGQLDPTVQWDVLVQGAPLLIEAGNLCWDYYRVLQEVPDDIGTSRAQRTVFGLDASGDLHIAVADGRMQYDQGLTLEEAALYMQSKGCTWALNFDGGGSSVLAQKGKGSLGQNQGAGERVVNHALLIWVVEPEPITPPATPPSSDAWKQEALNWLAEQGGIERPHDPNEPVEFAELAVVLKKLSEKGAI
ncbi:phosphodiester glycosidase family protein [Paenibacillus mucilaginosus]|nr:phosphodiester glycosidase family protein [Paenibacillus mucilaginosus]MCG7217347.1 phosphodiester glycosidase family protein [Paenibacillus mucilaginosus]